MCIVYSTLITRCAPEQRFCACLWKHFHMKVERLFLSCFGWRELKMERNLTMTDSKSHDLRAQENRVMAVDEWLDRWKEGKTGFHQDQVHKLADMGHTIVGVDVSEIAIKEFFTDQNLPYTEEPVPAIAGAKAFKSSDGKISLYKCNLYDFCSSIAGKFDGIWDRGSLVAINPSDRQRYATLIVSLMTKDCRYLLDTLLYNPSLYKGPPFYVPDDAVANLFGQMCNIQMLESVDALTERQKAWGIDYFTEKVHLLTLTS
ncbi:probable thiopurine S-methyltransferase isoform X2 [Polyodon spathula]|uniref:probable thiopurine S-methyltransferase isoform X2 n=1 Tax=Polyodon spathula TaxID=7913 RepID=UPI001B7F376E|nr:probable thiopurine S-methyltransferase isoform X2 [Polyodon spathula]